jgi:DNA-binding transcriptional regulator PaaX
MKTILKNKKYFRNEYVHKILENLAYAGLVVTLLAMPQLGAIGYILKQLNSDYSHLSKMRARRSLESLKRRELVYYHIKNNKLTIHLTEKGKSYYQKKQIESMQLPREKKWDGLWRMVSFDIPEKEKINRRHFSKTLNVLGLYNLEKSIFVYPYECQKQIQEIAEAFNVYKYVRYIKANYISRDEMAKNFFKL